MVSQVACFIRWFTRHTARLSLSLMKVTQVTVTPNRLTVTPNRLSSTGTTGWLSTVLATGGGGTPPTWREGERGLTRVRGGGGGRREREREREKGRGRGRAGERGRPGKS